MDWGFVLLKVREHREDVMSGSVGPFTKSIRELKREGQEKFTSEQKEEERYTNPSLPVVMWWSLDFSVSPYLS